jgi:hypothetical protein
MIDLIRYFVHEPLFSGMVLLCILIVGGLVISDWFDKRREKQLEQARAAAKLNRTNAEKPSAGFRIFRWQFAVVCAVLAVFLLSRSNDSTKVNAKPDEDTEVFAHQQQLAKTPDFVLPETVTEYVVAPTVDPTNTVAESTGAASRNSLFNFGSESESEWQGIDWTRDQIRGDIGVQTGINLPDHRRTRSGRK